MQRRRWINISVTARFYYWNCPGPKCSEIYWAEKGHRAGSCCCKTCGFKYTALQLENARLLVEVTNETKR